MERAAEAQRRDNRKAAIVVQTTWRIVLAKRCVESVRNEALQRKRCRAHEAFDWLMSPVSEKHTQMLNNNPIVEEEAEEGSRNVMEEEGVVL